MKKPGIITFNLLASSNINDLKKWLLLYDELWVPGLNDSLRNSKKETLDSDQEQIIEAIDLLVSKNQIIESPSYLKVTKDKSDEVTDALIKMYNNANKSLDKTYRTAEQAAKAAGAALFNIDISLSRLLIYMLWRERQEIAFPVIFPFNGENIMDNKNRIQKRQNVLSIIVKKFPEPDPNVPLKDLIDFKMAKETTEKFSSFWRWVKNVSEGNKDDFEISEEIDILLSDYRNYVNRLSKRSGNSKLKIFTTVIGNLAKLNIGDALSNVFELRTEKIDAYEAELKLPGSEIAYVKDAIDKLVQPKQKIHSSVE